MLYVLILFAIFNGVVSRRQAKLYNPKKYNDQVLVNSGQEKA